MTDIVKHEVRWTRFYDLSSGGRAKTPYDVIYIQASENGAIDEFERTFFHDPLNITCECCGEDYSIRELDEEAFARSYHEDKYIDKAAICIIHAEDISK